MFYIHSIGSPGVILETPIDGVGVVALLCHRSPILRDNLNIVISNLKTFLGHFFNMATIQVETTMKKNHEKGTFVNCHEHV